ncbi:protein kinase [Calothrix sp. PCC 7507]|uniref:protein kinase domain-containing protein n=1 Tax=Calothrix sp. PCC 7507 TaxID=99598 RepID=UPI00029F3C3D|nr:protein kinase [Calothrix sp. PCC 7507]AFY34373.1 serine/threonine protein kinase [Calothrix sp. PCC 7507]
MVNINNPQEVYCTRPGCQNPQNYIQFPTSGSVQQRYCSCCQMPLILDRYFLPIRLLVPDEQRGGFGRTFLAKDINTPQELLVIKQLDYKHSENSPPTPQQLEQIERLFRREAEVLANFDHPQIPKAHRFFSIDVHEPLNNGQQKFFYLVQEYIKGQNLLQWLREHGQFSGNEIIEFLKQILPVLQYVHENGAIHRDIKPSNIMRRSQDRKFCLIDFGSVKQVVQTGLPVGQSTFISLTLDYASPEQSARRAIDRTTDLYSLAATCIHLLTARSRSLFRNQDIRNWTEYATVNHDLERILNRMLSLEPQQRYQSAQEVKQEIDTLFPEPVVPPPPPQPSFFEKLKRFIDNRRLAVSAFFRKVSRRYWVLPLLVFALLGLAIAFLPTIIHCSKYEWDTDNGFSWGEQSLISGKNCGKNTEKKCEKDQGTAAFRYGKYDDAIKHFRKYLQSYQNDPEALIYLNNAIAARTDNPIKIATSVPITGGGVGEDILRGVAHAQSEFNCGIDTIEKAIKDTKSPLQCKGAIKGRLLQVQIIDDRHQNLTAENVADRLVKSLPILGVVGHYSSQDASRAAVIYSNQIVMISPGSTVPRNKYGLIFTDYVFRTPPTDGVSAKILVNHLEKINSSQNYWKALTVIDRTPYSNSLSQEFEEELKNKSIGKVFTTCDLSNKQGLNLATCVDNSIEGSTQNSIGNDRANIVLLAFSAETAREHANEAFPSSDVLILGGDGVYSLELLNKSSSKRLVGQKLVLAVPWQRSNTNREVESSGSKFEKNSLNIWGTSRISWRTAMGYDAAKAMFEGFKQLSNQGINLSRKDLYNVLASKDNKFSAPEGSTGKPIQFDRNNDRELNEDTSLGVLVHIVYSTEAKNKIEYNRLQ